MYSKTFWRIASRVRYPSVNGLDLQGMEEGLGAGVIVAVSFNLKTAVEGELRKIDAIMETEARSNIAGRC